MASTSAALAQGRVTVGAWREKFALSGAWNTSPRAFNAAATRHGEFSVLFDPASANRDQTFGTEWTLDVSAGYKTGGWTFTVGGDNVTTNIRTSSSCRNTTGAQIPYSAASPFGFNGAFMYGKVFKW